MKIKLRHTLLIGVILLAVSCSTEPVVGEILIPESENAVVVEGALLNVVNDHRASLGYNTLEYSAVAYEFANKHTDYMIAKGSLSHDNFSARASDISALENAEFVAENVAKDYDNAEEAFQGWLNSSSHKKTMEGDFTHTAVSVKKDAEGNFYFTQLFYR